MYNICRINKLAQIMKMTREQHFYKFLKAPFTQQHFKSQDLLRESGDIAATRDFTLLRGPSPLLSHMHTHVHTRTCNNCVKWTTLFNLNMNRCERLMWCGTPLETSLYL